MATIKGKWVFGTYGVDFDKSINEFVNFASNGINFVRMYNYGDFGMGYTYVLAYYTSQTSGYTEAAQHLDGGALAFTNQAYRTVDFGTTEQNVSDAFYNWFTANATPVPTDEVTIEYNGAVIASLKAGQSATLHCMGDNVKMLTDIVITVPAGMGGTELISFSIDGTSYQAEAGMTWAEWCDSEYNTGGAYVIGTIISYQNNYVSTDGEASGAVTPTDVISAQSYSLWGGTDGGGSN